MKSYDKVHEWTYFVTFVVFASSDPLGRCPQQADDMEPYGLDNCVGPMGETATQLPMSARIDGQDPMQLDIPHRIVYISMTRAVL